MSPCTCAGKYGPRCPENLVGGDASGAESGVSVTVAVKVPKDCAGVEAEADFMREVEIMSAFRHENIVSLIGIVATGEAAAPPPSFLLACCHRA